ncbi:MAG TPA: cytidylate kinase-like family protein [Pirellulales bacterium]|jgi:cytidylate kinase|nr:cytidylate kinase-like family protein [Pirellulales bacterium]
MSPSDLSARAVASFIAATQKARFPTEQEAGGLSAPRATPYTIALSREAGALGTSVARELSKRLNWPVYDHELLEALAKDLGVGTRLLEEADEKPASWLKECVEAFAAVPTVSGTTYFRHLLKALQTLSARGECVIVGRGAALILPPGTTLRVRLLATLEDRIAIVGRERHVSPAEAARYVETTDRARIRFIKDHFHKDPTDPQHYDLVVSTSRFSVVECADLILEALRLVQARHRPSERTERS